MAQPVNRGVATTMVEAIANRADFFIGFLNPLKVKLHRHGASAESQALESGCRPEQAKSSLLRLRKAAWEAAAKASFRSMMS